MNEKLKASIQTAWNEPRRFFLWMTFLSLAALGLGYVINLSTPDIQPSPGIESFGWTCAVLLALATMAGILGFLLSWIPPLHRVFSWMLKRRLFVLACLATIIALFYAEENWRGRHAWNKYRKQVEASGEVLDFKAFIPKPVPAEQNFAATQFIQSWFQRTNNRENGSTTFSFSWNDDFAAAENLIGTRNNKTNKAERVFMDLVAWRKAFENVKTANTNSDEQIISKLRDRKSREEVAPALLEDLKTSMTNIAELRAASKRPYSQYPVVYTMDNPWGILLPHLAHVKSVCKRLNVQACAELAGGQSENALENIKLILHMADSIKNEPFIISYLVRLACVQIATQPVWEGLAEQRWSDAQLQDIQSQFRHFHFFRDLKMAMDSERSMGILTVDLVRNDKKLIELFGLVDSGNGVGTYPRPTFFMISQLVPNGWFDFEKFNYLRLFQTRVEGGFDVNRERVFPALIEANSKNFEQEISEPYLILHHRVIARLLLPALGNLPYKAASEKVAADHIVLACGLDRYRMTHQQFPERLEKLMPQYLSEIPRDPFTGAPYIYRRTDDGQFVLYSVGRNQNDDGGIADTEKGDLVW